MCETWLLLALLGLLLPQQQLQRQLGLVRAEQVRYLEVSENAPPGTRVGFIDADSPPYLVVPVPGSPVDLDLVVDQATGEIRTRVSLDRETRSSYSLVALPQNVRVVVQVLDENDNAPTFPSEQVDVQFPENAPRDSKRALPPAKDPDLGQFSTQRYELVSGNVGEAFRLAQHRGRDGVLYLDLQSNGALDRESRAEYLLLVEALDGGVPALRSRLRVNVSVQDVNDNPPVFERGRYEASVPENASLGTAVLRVSASDADAGENGRVEYSINRRQSSDREEIFRVEADTGLVYLNKPLDFEERERHELVLVARDRGAQPLEATAFLSVRVLDVNDNQPAIEVIFLSDDATPKISESAQPGEFVARISVSDPDSRAEYSNATVRLSGGEGHFGLATRDNIVYLVVVERPLDREECAEYELRVEATDAGAPPLRALRSFRLRVSDVNDNAPRFLQERYEAHLLEASEPGTSVLKVSAVDADEGLNARLRYSLLNGSTWFGIDEDTGLISTASHVDCESEPSPLLLVVASDSGKPALSSTVSVRITVHDVNDNEPIFEKPFYNLTVPEDLPPGRCFLKVLATDFDCGVNSVVNYTIASELKASEHFVVHSDTGDICILAGLDRETTDYYELPLIATDRGGLSATSIVQVLISDVNDNRPRFQPLEYNVTLKVDTSINEPIVRCYATDLDIDRFGQVTYAISSGNEAGLFRINKTTGEIYIIQLNRTMRSSKFLLNITATDAAGLKNIRDALVRIFIELDSQTAGCDKPRYKFTIKEDVSQNTFIGSLRIPNTSSTTGNNVNKFYFMTEVLDFTLEAATGTIRTKQLLDREIHDRYIFGVVVPNSISVGYCQVEIIVDDVNDNQPSFVSSSVRISVPESYPLHKTLYVAHAYDPDITPVVALRYSLSQNNNEIFGINARSGEVFLIRRLDYETQQRHRLLIKAFDGADLFANLSLNVEVQDVNDNPPVFERNEYYAEISESAKLDSQIIQVTAVDLDTGNNARLTYQLRGAEEFRMNPNTGWILLAGQLDRETVDHYSLMVLATDSGSPAATASALVHVTVLDENDNDPHFESGSYSFDLLENQPEGMLVGTVKASDPDLDRNSILRYSIVQPNSSFVIDPVTGVIKTRELLDRETKAVYELVLEARDQGVPSRAARVPLRVCVLDVNDNSPEIVDPQGDVVSVREDQPIGTEVARVRALDLDHGKNASVTYTILKDRDSDGYSVFSIDPISGMIKTKAILEHEERNVYQISVKASDAGKPPRHSIRILRVEVLALTDNRPTFTSSSLTFKVREDASIGDSVGSVSGSSSAGRVAYTLDSLHPISSTPAFDVDRISGQLVVARLLDRENVSEYHLKIRALDTTSTGNPQSIAVSVKIIIEDANDNHPHWLQDPIIINVSENTMIGSTIYNLSATDADDGLNGDLQYDLVAEYPAGNSFAVDSLTGALILVQTLDRERRAEYTLVLKAEDRAPLQERLASTVTARIFVIDENDNDPYFVAPDNTNLSIAPNILPGSQLIRVIAIDQDAGDNGRVTYIISSGNEEDCFTIGYESGLISLVRPVLHSIQLEITARDHGIPLRQKTLTLNLTIDGNQSKGSPRLLLYNPVARISENIAVGTDILNVASSAIHSQGNVTFIIPQGVTLNKFSISSQGIVNLLAPLDREEKAHYSVPILAKSNKVLDLTTLDIIVLDENDNSPVFKPGSCYKLAIPENQETNIIHTLVATDADEGRNGEIIYSIISGNIDSKFKLDPQTGVLSSSSLDRETVSKYVLTVSAKDKGRQSHESHCNLTITVLDVNDNAPVFLHNQYSDSRLQTSYSLSSSSAYSRNNSSTTFTQGKYSTTISEDVLPESSIMQVQATDFDQGVNAKITYFIAEESTWLFRIDNLTGVITTSGFLDRERQSFYSFLVVASDSGKYKSHETSVPVEIHISDVNDNYPIFEEYPFRARIPTNTQPGQSILRVKANDADYDSNAEIVYTFLDGQDKPKFRLHANTGIVTVTSSLIQENGRFYQLGILATDKGNPPLSAQGLIELRIGDFSDFVPMLKFQNDSYVSAIQEHSPIGSEIIQVTAVRSDGRRQHITYSIGSGNDQNVFSIDKETGIVSVLDSSKLDAELWHDEKMTLLEFASDNEQNSSKKYWENNNEKEQLQESINEGSKYVLTLVAQTIGPDPLEAYTKLIVQISDINDNAPIFTQSQYIATVLEGNAKGDFVVKLSANDMDKGLNSRLLYHIVDGNLDNAFTIDPPYSGIVRTNIVLDREIREKYRLTIIATDQGNPQLTGTAALTIRVIDINDNQPTFPEHKIISIPEDTVPGTVLTTVTANDVDSSPVLMYYFNNTSDFDLFSIDQFGGRITLTGALDAEIRSEYMLHVIVSDGLHKATTELTIKIIDLNDNAPRFQQQAYLITLSDQQDNMQELLKVNATDDDLSEENNQIHYHLSPPFKGFNVRSMDGILFVNQSELIKPLPKEIELSIVAEDSGKPPLSTTCTVIIRLNGLKNNSLRKEYKLIVKENAVKGTILLRLSDIDFFDGVITSDNKSEFFEVFEGKLILADFLDRETQNRYELRLGPKFDNSTTGALMGVDPVTIIIDVEDVNDNYPIFTRDVYEVSIKEDAIFGHTVTSLQADDNDLSGSLASRVVYDVTSGNDAGLFQVNRSSGAILVNASLDCDLNPGIYHLVVMACDSDPIYPLCTLTQLFIRLQDVNDNPPKFPVSEYLEFIGENEPIGTTVFIAHASDLDRGIYGVLNYSIVSATANKFYDMDDSWKLFSIDAKSGVVITRAIFDYEQRSRYAFTLHATDTGGRTVAVKVRVEVESRDEFYPQFTERIYHFGIRIASQALPNTVIGFVTATDRDKGPDGRVVYQLLKQHPFFKLNRTTGALIVKQKLNQIDISAFKDSSKFIVSASSGRQGSLSNTTTIKISMMDNGDSNISHGITALVTPTDINSQNMTVVGKNMLADWVLALLIALLLLISTFGFVFLYLHIKSRHREKSDSKPGLTVESNATATNSYVDPSAFDTIQIRSITTIGTSVNNSTLHGTDSGGIPCQFAPPKYDEIPPYGTSGQSRTQATSELSGTDRSGSSGRGSAEDDGEDEEIRMINEGQQIEDSTSDMSVQNTQEYLARLGIVDPPVSTPRRPPEALPLDSLHLFEDETNTEADIATLLYGKIGDSGRLISGLEVPGGPSMNGSLSSIVHSEEELTGSYNWDYLLDWGPQYQPLAHVFGEIARLKDDSSSVLSSNSNNSNKVKSVHKAPPPPLLTSVAPRMLSGPTMTRVLLPRSPISHDSSTFPSAALSPSFSPSLSPLATRSPSISPLVPTATSRSQCPSNDLHITDSEFRI